VRERLPFPNYCFHRRIDVNTGKTSRQVERPVHNKPKFVANELRNSERLLLQISTSKCPNGNRTLCHCAWSVLSCFFLPECLLFWCKKQETSRDGVGGDIPGWRPVWD